MFCTNCGQELVDDAKFCTNCGKMMNNELTAEDSGNQSILDNIDKKEVIKKSVALKKKIHGD